MMFRYEMAHLRELSLNDLMALRTKCGWWLKHIELEIEERRQEQQDIFDRKEPERAAEAVRRRALMAQLYPREACDPSSPTDNGDWCVARETSPCLCPPAQTPDSIPEPALKTEDGRNIQEPPLKMDDNPDI